MNPVFVGQLTTAEELGIDPSEVGCNCSPEVGFGISIPNPVKLIDRTAKRVIRTAKKVPGLNLGISVADRIIKSKPVSTIQKIASNPVVSTVMGPRALPLALGIATARGGAQGALNHARKELKNPVRGIAIKAVAIIFPPTAPAAAALETVNRVLDAAESGDTAEAAKATAQIAATYALAETGDAGAKKAVEVFNKAKAIRKNIPRSIMTPSGYPRIEVCGAKSEENRGVWLKTHFWMDGPYMVATVYSVTGGDAEVFNLRVDLRPIAEAVARYHKKLHGEEATVSGSLFSNLANTVKKIGRGKLTNQVFKTSRGLAVKAKCKAMTPNRPVSNSALAAFASARKGVDAVDSNKKLSTALRGISSKLKKYTAVKGALLKMPFARRVKALKNPSVKGAVLQGIGAKFAAARFIKAGGPAKAAKLRQNAMRAAANFAILSRATKSTNPAVRNEAQTMARVVNIAAKARAKTRNVTQNSKDGTAGLVITSRGKIRKGRFRRRTPGHGQASSVMLTKNGIQTGIFDTVSGEFDEELLGEHPNDEFTEDIEDDAGLGDIISGGAGLHTLRNRIKRIQALSTVPKSVAARRALLRERIKRIRKMAVVGCLEDEVGRSSVPSYSRALRRRIMACRAGCETELAGVEDPFDDSADYEEVGRSSVPSYSRALRRRIMACRAGCETELAGVDPFDDGTDDDFGESLVGAVIRTARATRAARSPSIPRKKSRRVRRVRRSSRKARPVFTSSRKKALKAIARLPRAKKAAVIKKIVSRLSPEKKRLLAERIRAKRAAMTRGRVHDDYESPQYSHPGEEPPPGYDDYEPPPSYDDYEPPQYTHPGEEPPPSYDDYESDEEYEDDDFVEEENPHQESLEEEDFVEDPYEDDFYEEYED